jgi:hypothetical protein
VALNRAFDATCAVAGARPCIGDGSHSVFSMAAAMSFQSSPFASSSRCIPRTAASRSWATREASCACYGGRDQERSQDAKAPSQPRRDVY